MTQSQGWEASGYTGERSDEKGNNMIIGEIVGHVQDMLKEALAISEELAEGDEISWYRLKKHGRMEDLIEQAIEALNEVWEAP